MQGYVSGALCASYGGEEGCGESFVGDVGIVGAVRGLFVAGAAASWRGTGTDCSGITRVTPLDFVSYPISHSLLMQLVWGSLLGAIYFFWRRDFRTAMVVGALLPTHWLLCGIQLREHGDREQSIQTRTA